MTPCVSPETNFCRDRHDPNCQVIQCQRWIEVRLERVLPVPHICVVFTLPAARNPLVLRNQSRLCNRLFRAASSS